jgi:hypothetical protein
MIVEQELLLEPEGIAPAAVPGNFARLENALTGKPHGLDLGGRAAFS